MMTTIGTRNCFVILFSTFWKSFSISFQRYYLQFYVFLFALFYHYRFYWNQMRKKKMWQSQKEKKITLLFFVAVIHLIFSAVKTTVHFVLYANLFFELMITHRFMLMLGSVCDNNVVKGFVILWLRENLHV